jgi:hypothetical protein
MLAVFLIVGGIIAVLAQFVVGYLFPWDVETRGGSPTGERFRKLLAPTAGILMILFGLTFLLLQKR